MLGKLRSRLDYASVMSTIAVFIALGGTSYAMTLPRNSVGPSHIRSHAVGASEIRPRAVRSKHINDRSVALKDISRGARLALKGATGQPGPAGPMGPPGVTYSAAVNSGGDVVSGNGTPGTHNGGSGTYEVKFGRDMTTCRTVATLSRVPGGGTVDPLPGEITTSTHGGGVTVRTYNSAGTLTDQPFHLIAVC